MKKWIILLCLLCSNLVSAESNCNRSEVTLVNLTDKNLEVYSYAYQLYFPTEYTAFNRYGILKNIAVYQYIAPNKPVTIFANSNSGSRGDIHRNVKLTGDKGVIDIDFDFETALWGFGTCSASFNVISSQYDVKVSKTNGIPARATVEIR